MRTPFVIVCAVLWLAAVGSVHGRASTGGPAEQSPDKGQGAQPSGRSTAAAITADPHADLPTQFGDEDDVIQRKQNAASQAALAASAAAANAGGVLKVPSSGAGKGAINKKHDPLGPFRAPLESDEDENYDDDDEDDGDEDTFLLSSGRRTADDTEDSEYKSGDYAEESDLGQTLDNFGAQLPGDGETGTDELPIFLLEPQSTFVIRSRAAVLKCKAAHALQVSCCVDVALSITIACFAFGLAIVVCVRDWRPLHFNA